MVVPDGIVYKKLNKLVFQRPKHSVLPLEKKVTSKDTLLFRKKSKFVAVCHYSIDKCLTFMLMDLTSVRIAVFTDASCVNCDDYKSHLGFLICLTGKHDTANIVHYV
jgi:hypothetical protein